MELVYFLLGVMIGAAVVAILALIFRQKQQRLDVRNQFVSMASHQLRTPLTSIKGYISMILDGDAGEINSRQRQFLTEAFESSERMVRMIADFLDVSRIDQGRFELSLSCGNLADVLRREIESYIKTAQTHQLKVELNISPDLENLQIKADFDKLRQVMTNFIDNAIFYSQAGGRIEILLERHGKNLIFRVKDQGIGVPIKQQKKLFSKFYRASNARRQRPDGTGIGLFLAQEIIRAHNGKIIFSSTEGKGSEFGFSLPIK